MHGGFYVEHLSVFGGHRDSLFRRFLAARVRRAAAGDEASSRPHGLPGHGPPLARKTHLEKEVTVLYLLPADVADQGRCSRVSDTGEPGEAAPHKEEENSD